MATARSWSTLTSPACCLGATLATRPPDVYRALIEATAFGTRMIVEAFEAAGVAVNDIVGCGGLPERNPLLMQIYADVTGREMKVAESLQAPALGSAMFGAVAAGSQGRADTTRSSRPRRGWHAFSQSSTGPNKRDQKVYDELFAEYRALHDYFGRGGNDVMKRLKSIRARALSTTAQS